MIHLPNMAISSPLPPMEARELAKALVPFLETVANIHYLLDMHVADPARLRALRATEDDAFTRMVELVSSHLG